MKYYRKTNKAPSLPVSIVAGAEQTTSELYSIIIKIALRFQLRQRDKQRKEKGGNKTKRRTNIIHNKCIAQSNVPQWILRRSSASPAACRQCGDAQSPSQPSAAPKNVEMNRCGNE
jgi:hypothetical protein